MKPSNMKKDTKYPHHKPRGRGNDNSQTKRDKDFKTSPRQAFTKFKGNTPELYGFVFDCSDNKQADRYVTAMKRIAEHIEQTTTMEAIFAQPLSRADASTFPSLFLLPLPTMKWIR